MYSDCVDVYDGNWIHYHCKFSLFIIFHLLLSFHHSSTIQSVSSTLIRHAYTMSDKYDHHHEVPHITTALKFNGYPTHKVISKPSEGRACVILTFIGQSTSHHIQLTFKNAKVVVHHRSTHKLKYIIHTHEDRRPPNHHPGVYRIPCECGKVYIGETSRTFTTRLVQHQAHNRLGEWVK